MTALEDDLMRRWGHSFEDDVNGLLVYRPADYDFPRARGRDGIEFQPGGVYVEWMIGPGDGRVGKPGTWMLCDDGQLLVTVGALQRLYELSFLSADRLELRPLPTPGMAN